jgi:RNA polymerase sigma-70 factor (ECF subfamily)
VEPCWFDSSLESREDARQVEAAVAKLPENQREVVVLRIWAGLTFAEIGKTTRQSLNTVAAQYRYALNNLRKQLEYEHASS